MKSPRIATCLGVAVAALLTASAPRAAPADAPARAAEPEPAFENDESGREADYFDRLLGGRMDGDRYRAILKAAASVRPESPPAKATAVNSWQLVGPLYSVNTGGGNMTGRVRDIDAHNLRVLAATGGLWRFHFGAIAMSDSVPATWFGSFASNPSDANTILLGTGEIFFGESGTGLYKTTDGGATWTHKPMTPDPSAFSRIRYSPDGAIVHAAANSGYYRSTDGGETWVMTFAGDVTDLSTVAADPSLVYIAVNFQGIFHSSDGGQTWAEFTSGGIPFGGVGAGAVSAIEPTPGGPVWIYVSFNSSDWRSEDSGATWTNITPPYTVGVSNYGPCISVCPTNPLLVLMGNVPFNRSTDGGATWTKITSSHLHADYHVFAWDDNGIGVWAGNDGGWFHSTDSGLTWDSSANVMPVSQFYTVDCEKTETGYMLGGTQDNNVLYTPTEALFWTDPAVGSTEGDAFGVCLDVYNPSHMWAISGVVGGAFPYPRYRTLDGTTWTPVDNGIPASSFTGSIRTDNAFPVRLVTSVESTVYESQDGGDTWTAASPSFTSNIQNLTSSTRVSPSSVLYACISGFNGSQRLMVRDGGTWYERSYALPPGSVWKVEPHPWAASASEAWAIVISGGYRLYHTLDRGVSWADITGDFPTTIPITDIVPNPRNSSDLYIGTYAGCYRSKNGGVNWERWTNGMPPTAKVTEMTYIDLTASGGPFSVVAATFGRSVWKRDISGDDPMPSISVGDGVCIEGNSGTSSVFFPITLSAPQSRFVSVQYSTADGTATTADNDYVPTSGTVVFAPGTTQSSASVLVNGDTQPEGDETFSLVLSNPVRATIANSGTGTILDDDSHVLVRQRDYITDGPVNTVVSSGGVTYIGGLFSKVGPATGSAVPLDATTGQAVWLPEVAGTVLAVAPDGAGGWYLGGNFTYVGGLPRSNLARVLADHTVDSWAPPVNDAVNAIAVNGDTVYVGGNFTAIGLTPRNHLAAIDRLQGTALPWDPNADGNVQALARSGGVVYAAGYFTHAGGQPRGYIAALNGTSGLATSADPSANAEVIALAASGGTVYAGGAFTSIGGQSLNNLAALNAATGAASPTWIPNPDNTVLGLAVSGGTLYAGGYFTTIDTQSRHFIAALDAASGHATPWVADADDGVQALAVSGSQIYAGGTFTTIGGQPRHNLACLDATSGGATSWNPDPNAGVYALGVNGSTVLAGGAFLTLAPQPRASIAALDANTGLVTPWNPGANASVSALLVNGGIVYAGGGFDSIGGQPRSNIAALDATTGLATAWNPGADGSVRALLLVGTSLGVGGQFTHIAGAARNRIAALNTTSGAALTWNPNCNGTVGALATDGTVIFAGGAFTFIGGQLRSNIATLDGISGAATTFNPGANGAVTTMQAVGSAVYVGGAFTTIGGLARGRGAVLSTTKGIGSWNPGADGPINALAPTGGASVYIGGSFQNAGGLPRRHLALIGGLGTASDTWCPDPSGNVNAIALNGSTIYAAGQFTRIAGLPQAHIACLIPTSLVSVPPPTPGADLALRVGPSPTSGRVELDYTLPAAARVHIGVYDIQGRRIASPIDEMEAAGPHVTSWSGSDGQGPLRPGLYFVRLESGRRLVLGRFVVVR